MTKSSRRQESFYYNDIYNRIFGSGLGDDGSIPTTPHMENMRTKSKMFLTQI